MNPRFLLRCLAGLCGVVVVYGLFLAPLRADTIVITNITGRPGFTPRPAVLSDLVAYPVNPFLAPLTILKPGDATDDITMKVGAVRRFDVPFAVDRFTVSEMVKGKEQESTYLHLRSTVLTAMLDDPAGNPLYLAVNGDLYTPPPPVGTMVAINGGTTPSEPGWFVGTSFDFNTGTVSGPYTGEAIVDAVSFAVDVVPEPASLVLLGTGAAGLLWRLRKRRRAG